MIKQVGQIFKQVGEENLSELRKNFYLGIEFFEFQGSRDEKWNAREILVQCPNSSDTDKVLQLSKQEEQVFNTEKELDWL